MARKSLEQQLIEAIQSGDMEKSKSLVEQIKHKKKNFKIPSTRPKIKKLPAPQTKEKNKKNTSKTNKIKKEEPIDSQEEQNQNVVSGNFTGKGSAEGGIAARIEKLFTGKRKNLFQDDREEAKEDSGIVLTRPIKNKKPKFKTQKIQCKICNKTYEVAPSFVRYDENGQSLYRCNSCCGGR